MSFTRLDASDIAIQTNTIVRPMWSFGTNNLNTSSSVSVAYGDPSGFSFWSDFTASSGEIQFSISNCYSEYSSGCPPFNVSLPVNSNIVNYRRFLTLVFGKYDDSLRWYSSDSNLITTFLAVQIDRNRYNHRISIDNFLLRLQNIYEDSQFIIDLTIDASSKRMGSSGYIYNLIGTPQFTGWENYIKNGYYLGATPYGLIVPDIGLILINQELFTSLPDPFFPGDYMPGVGFFDENLSAYETSWEVANRFSYWLNPNAYNNPLWGDGAFVNGYGGRFVCSSEEDVPSNYVFVRAKAAEYNYSTNPSFSTGSSASGSLDILNQDMVLNPRTYITSVGLYNDNCDLLAVAKMSTPLKKDPINETFLRLKLDW